jgi:hypothetical protein
MGAGNGNKGREHRTETPDVSHIKNVDVNHETSDINVAAVFKFVLFLTVLTVVTFVLMWGLFRLFNSQADKREPPPGPMAMTEQERLPPEPRLQGAPGFGEDLAKGAQELNTTGRRDPTWEIRVLRKQWEDGLEHGARDSNGNVVGLPIDQAIKQVAEGRVINVRPNAGNALDYAIEMPTAASSGRMAEKRLE